MAGDEESNDPMSEEEALRRYLTTEERDFAEWIQKAAALALERRKTEIKAVEERIRRKTEKDDSGDD
jgi:hypothetical protein